MALSRGQILKFIELVLVIICVVLHYNSFEAGDSAGVFFQSGVYGGYLIIAIGVGLGFVFIDSAPGRKLDLYFTLLGGILYIAAGYLAWDRFHGRSYGGNRTDYGLAKAWVSVATGIVFIVDAVFGFRD